MTIVALLYFNKLARRALAAYSRKSEVVQGSKSGPENEKRAGPTKDGS